MRLICDDEKVSYELTIRKLYCVISTALKTYPLLVYA